MAPSVLYCIITLRADKVHLSVCGLKCYTISHHFNNMIEIKKQTCTWIGDGECCQHIAIIGKAYCEKHYERVYTTFLPEMAQYIIDKEIEVGCG